LQTEGPGVEKTQLSGAMFLAAGAISCMEGRASIGGDTTFTNNIASHGGETLGKV